MLQADDAQERLTAASALLPLGRHEVALPVILESLESDAEGSFQAAAGALTWLVRLRA